jgi:RNA polymerase sigma-70 factor (ECF subfamily)
MADVDDKRFEQLYHQHFHRVAAYLLARSDREFAEEALARTFEVAWRRFADVPEEPLPWLFGVARRVLADLRRAQGRQSALIDRMAMTIVGQDEVAGPGEAAVERLAALNAFQELSPMQQEALLLIAWDGLTQKQAAEAMHCSRGAFALRLYRARARLQASIRAREAEPPSSEAVQSPRMSIVPRFDLSVPAIEEAT